MTNSELFFQALFENDVIRCKEMLQATPALATATKDGATALHYAALENQREIVDLLIAAGADLNIRDEEYGAAPIGWANEKGHSEMVLYLFEKGANVDLHRAAAFGLTEKVKDLLASENKFVNTISGYGTPLHEAALWAHPEIVSLLLKNGADPHSQNSEGKTALEIVREQLKRDLLSTTILIPARRKEMLLNYPEVIKLLSAA